jgi:SAM-dependent methyltransferase
MRDRSRVEDFISATPYTEPVNIKKLRFIFSALDRYATTNGKEFKELHVLEVACGRGGITLALASLGCQVKGFDIDEEAVKYLQGQMNQRRAGNVSLAVANGYTFDDGEVYDIVIASEVFEHVLEPSRLAGNITKRMMGGSFLVVTTPNGYGPWELKNRIDIRTYLKNWNALRRVLRKKPYLKGSGPGHCQFYTRGRLLDLFSAFSLSLIDFAKSDSFLAMSSALRKNIFLGELDTRIADLLPYWLASGWYFVFQLQRPSEFTAI